MSLESAPRGTPLRFLVLAAEVFSSSLNQVMWLSYAPIASHVAPILGIEVTTVNWLSIIFMIAFFPGVAMFSVILELWGLRGGLLVGSSLNTVCGWIRFGAAVMAATGHDSSGAFALSMFGQLFAALAQPVFVNTPARIASEWFPAPERELATAAGSASQFIGLALGQVLPSIALSVDCTSGEICGPTAEKLMYFLLIQACVSTLITAVIAFGVPTKPAVAPSSGAALRDSIRAQSIRALRDASGPGTDTTRIVDPLLKEGDGSKVEEGGVVSGAVEDEGAGEWEAAMQSVRDLGVEWWALIRNTELLKAVFGFGFGLGAFNAVLTLLEQVLHPCGYTTNNAGILGGVMLGAGLVGAFSFALLLEATKAHTWCVRGACAGTLGALLGVIFLSKDGEMTGLYISFAFLGFFLCPILPICLEAAAEHTYPIPEEASAALLLGMGQVVGIATTPIVALLIPKHGTTPQCGSPAMPPWALLLAVMALACVFLSWFSPSLQRHKAETDAKQEEQEEQVDVGEGGSA